MATYKFRSCPADCYNERTHKDCIDAQLCESIGDWVYLEGCRLCGFFETEFEKITLGTRGVTNRYTTFCFMSCLFPYPECGMTVEFKGKRYTVGEVLEDNPQGWTCLELNSCEVC